MYSWSKRIIAIDKHEHQKSYPDRFPINSGSIGIELVSMHINYKTYNPVTACQNTSLQWLIGKLYRHFGLDKNDVYRHLAVSYKNPGEAASAKWK